MNLVFGLNVVVQIVLKQVVKFNSVTIASMAVNYFKWVFYVRLASMCDCVFGFSFVQSPP